MRTLKPKLQDGHLFGTRARTSARRRGFTLIEVIIALAIFVIGALAIIRIFPPALASIQGAGNRTNGARLASSELARMSVRIGGTEASRVPDAIFFGTSPSTFNTTFGGAFNGTITSNSSLPRDARLAGNGNAANDSALQIGTSGSGSYIEGERQRVMKSDNGTPSNLADDFNFLLTSFPYADGSSVLPSHEETIEGVRVNVDYAGGSPKYYFDFTNATLPNGASWSNSSNAKYPQGTGAAYTYYISYKWIEANTAATVHGIDEQAYVFPLPNASGIDNLKTALSDRIVVAPTITPTRPRSLVEGEVKVRVVEDVSPVFAPLNSDNERRGLVILSGGWIAGETARVSYRVNDWRNIVVDQATSGDSVFLTTRGLDDDLYSNVYALVYSAPDSNGVSKNVPRSGECAPDSSGACSNTADALAEVKAFGNQTNRVRFESSASGVGGLTAPRARIVYRPLDGWGVQSSVAARTYAPFLDYIPTNYFPDDNYGYVRQLWREYAWSSGSSNIYFQPSEAGKTIAVTFAYNDGTERVAKDRIITINDRTVDAPAGFPGAGGKASVAELVDLNGNLGPTVTSILSIRGLSVQARAVWADNSGRYNQTVATDYRKSS